MTRPESPNLDTLQMADLQKFLTGRPREQLEEDLQQLVNDSQADKGPYSGGGVPANVSRTYIIIQEALEQSAKKK
jgi:hypothetical protein